ncbi:hypothetical protein [Tropicibacter naphthalenivorans]|nr:hypothetical protein [Tropicibacter naphthalenivorans]
MALAPRLDSAAPTHTHLFPAANDATVSQAIRTPAAERFRHVLRAAMIPHHDAAEFLFDRFMHDPETHMDWFLSTQLAATWAFVEPMRALAGDDLGQAMLAVLNALEADCARRGLTPTPVAPYQGSALAAAYVLLGARLGATMMQRHMESLGMTALPAFFTKLDGVGDAWKTVVERLDAIDPTSAEAATLTTDATAAFKIFELAATAAPPQD